MKKSYRTLLTLLLTFAALLCLAVPAVGADNTPAPGRTGRLTIWMHAPDSDVPIYGGVFEVFHVAQAASGPAGEFFRLTPDFADSGILLEDLSADGIAEHLVSYARDKGLTGKVAAAGKVDGRAAFPDLAEGLYLVCQKGTVDGWLQSRPFFVAMPFIDDDGTASYEVVASPKTEPLPTPGTLPFGVRKEWSGRGNPPDSISVSLLRDGAPYETVTLSAANNWTHVWPALSNQHVWSVAEITVSTDYNTSYTWEDPNVVIKNTFTPNLKTDELKVVKVWDDAGDWSGKRPADITVHLYQDGGLYDTAVLNDANGWTHHWTSLPAGSSWSLFELNVPEGYEVIYEQQGALITIINRNPPPPPLIKTGQLNWPVPLLAALGLVLFAVGWVMTRRGGRNQNEPNR